LAQIVSIYRPELEYTPSNCLIGDIKIALGRQLLEIAIPQGEAQIEPDGTTNDLRRELVTGVAKRLHAPALSPYRSTAHTVKIPVIKQAT